jgi:hypothetical protein
VIAILYASNDEYSTYRNGKRSKETWDTNLSVVPVEINSWHDGHKSKEMAPPFSENGAKRGPKCRYRTVVLPSFPLTQNAVSLVYGTVVEPYCTVGTGTRSTLLVTFPYLYRIACTFGEARPSLVPMS